jgi:hypothetical protein
VIFGIVHTRHDDRDGTRRVLGRADARGAVGDQDVDLAGDQLGGEGREALGLAVGVADL